jgi:hypothetical protein
MLINNLLPPEEAEEIKGRETTIHLIPLWRDIIDAHKGRMTYHIGIEDHHVVASDYLLEARMRQAKDPRDKLYGLY